MSLLRSVWRIMATDAALLRRFPRYALAIAVVALVPALYALIYLSSVWDPNAQTHALPVAVVNLDAGIDYRGRAVNVGAELTRELTRAGTFGFRPVADAAAARQAVRQGRFAFAIVIPADFSANAVPGTKPGGGQVTVVLSEGNNYASAGMARRFAQDLGHQANEKLNEQRWEQVLASADGSGRSLEDLRNGIGQLQAGLQSVDESLAKYHQAVNRLAAAIRKTGAELHGVVEARLPSDAELQSLKNGTQRLVARQRELTAALETARSAERGDDGGPARDDAVAAAPAQPPAGAAAARDGLHAALTVNSRLTQGVARAEAGVGRLVERVGLLGPELQAGLAGLPAPAALDALDASGRALLAGTANLRFGVEMAKSVLPAPSGKLDGSARGLADSVEPVLEVLAPVANNGSAFAPNMVAMSLWLGAVMIIYVCSMQTLPARHAGASPLARTLGKFALPAAVALVQALCVLLMLVFGLGVPVPDPATFALSMAVSALAFLALVFVLLRAFGEAGKLVAVLLLTLQLAAGGGVLPIELSGELFRAMHEWLPFTWVVRAMRASLFGAFDGNWLRPVAVVAAVGLVSLAVSAGLGRWRIVAEADYRPPIDP